MFKSEDYDSFEQLFDRLSSLSSTEQSLKINGKPVQVGSKRDPNAMDVDALGKGKAKGDTRKSSTRYWLRSAYERTSRDCANKGKGKSKSSSSGKGKGSG